MVNQNVNVNRIIFGVHAIQALLSQRPQDVYELFIQHERQDEKIQRCITLAKQKNVPLQLLSKNIFLEKEKQYHINKSQGIIALCRKLALINSLEELLPTLTTVKPLLLILDGVQDPHNLGACLRSANAAGAQAVIIPQDRAVPINATVHKVASGAAEFTPVITVTNLARALQQLKDHGVWLYGMAGEATTALYGADFTYPSAFILGAEGQGLRRLTRDYCDELLAIPMQGNVGSLNVSVAAGICLFEAVRQRTLPLK